MPICRRGLGDGRPPFPEKVEPGEMPDPQVYGQGKSMKQIQGSQVSAVCALVLALALVGMYVLSEPARAVLAFFF